MRTTSRTITEIEGVPLESIPLFRYVAAEVLEGIIDSCAVRTVPAGESLLTAGCDNDELYILLSGRLRVHLRDVDMDPVAYLEPGEIAGELSIVDGNPTSAHVVADISSRVLVMGRKTIWSLVDVSHAAACNLLSILSLRVRSANERLLENLLREHSYHRFGTIDALTGMHNRHWLNGALPRLLERSRRSGKKLSLLMIDIDAFKAFNDRYGHLCGDRAIHTVAQEVMDNLRSVEVAARYGGDEFVILLPGIDAEQAVRVAERLHRKVREKEITLPDGAVVPPLTISIGVTGAEKGSSAEEVLAAADAALYRAKEKGRDSVSG